MSGTRRLVLASTSRYRRELIGRLGLSFELAAPPFDEEAAQATMTGQPLAHIVAALARGKVQSLASAYPDALVLGADQMAELDGVALGKPHTVERACAQLRAMAGRSHRLLTAVALLDTRTGACWESLSTHTMHVRALSDTQIESYVQRDQPLDCAGSYRVESLGIALFERMDGDDFTGIVGLPLTHVTSLLMQAGIDVLGARSG